MDYNSSPRMFPEKRGKTNTTSNFGLRGPQESWVCPNDRQLALRAKLRTGWSVKTSQFNTYPKPQPLTEAEQQKIISVVKKAEELDLSEQKRVGILVDRLESLKRLATGNGVTDCILCGESFGISVFGRTNFRCCDCSKAVCRKCVVELSHHQGGYSHSSTSISTSKDATLRLCKICAENRELIKRSGAWFIGGVPKYILPEKKNNYRNNYETSSPVTSLSQSEEQYTSRYLNISSASGSSSSTSGSKRVGGVLWSRGLQSQSEGENDSSSGDETTVTSTHNKSSSEKFLFRRMEENTSRPSTSRPMKFLASSGPEDNLYEIVSDTSTGEGVGISIKEKFEKFEPSGSIDQTTLLSDNTVRSSGSSSNNDAFLLNSSTTMESCSPSPSSQPQSPIYGIIEASVLFDDSHHALHVTVRSIKDLTPMDINGLSDPFCVLKLIPSPFQGGQQRTKTLHKTLNPVFNETLTFYGISQSHLVWQSLQITVIDDDRWGKDCLGFVQIPLHRIRPQQTRTFNLYLENGKLISNGEEGDWSRGSLLLSLSYMTEKGTLVVGLVRAQELPIPDNGVDPFVKVRLIHDTTLGPVSSNFHPGSRKYKSSVKWKTTNPDFQEEFAFKVSVIDLPRLAVVISVWEKDSGKLSHYIGGLVLSCASKGDRLRHFHDMMKLPNVKHAMWHSLSPSEVPGI